MLAILYISVVLAAGNFAALAGYFDLSAHSYDRERRYQSEHFVLTLPAGQNLGRLLEELERARQDVMSYGLPLRDRISARCYSSSAEFARQACASSMHLACVVDGEIRLQPAPLLLRRGDLSRALRHELTHLAVGQPAARSLPLWINEGLAMAVAGESFPATVRFRRLGAIEDTLRTSRSYRALRSAYGTSRRLLDRLIAQVGRAKVVEMVRLVRTSSDFDRVFRELTGMTPDQWGDSALAGR